MVERYYVELGANPVSAGLAHVDWEDGLSEAVVVDGRGALRLVANPLTPPRYLYFNVDDHLFFNTNVTVEIIVEYRSESSGSFSLHYDAVDTTSGPLEGAYHLQSSPVRRPVACKSRPGVSGNKLALP